MTVPSFGEHCAHSVNHQRPVFGCAAAKPRNSKIGILVTSSTFIYHTPDVCTTCTHSARKPLLYIHAV